MLMPATLGTRGNPFDPYRLRSSGEALTGGAEFLMHSGVHDSFVPWLVALVSEIVSV